MIRIALFTDTDEWYAGSRSKGAFNQPLDEWAAQIGVAHGRPVKGFEFEHPDDDPRTGTLVEDAPEPAPPEDPDRDALVAALRPGATRAEKDVALAVLLRRVVGDVSEE